MEGAAGELPNSNSCNNTCLATLDFAGLPALLETGVLEHAGWDEVAEIFFERGRLRITTPAPLLRKGL